MSAQSRKTAEAIFTAAVEAVQPQHLMRSHVSLHEDELRIAGQSIPLQEIRRVRVVGAGKATAAMAQALESVLGERITDGLIIVKHGHGLPLHHIRTVEAAHPVPDESGIRGTAELLTLLSDATENDLVIALISGGGSALLIDLPEGCTLNELQRFFELMLQSGADIGEMNTLRKHLSAVKGGQLAKAAYPARLHALILSDVIGDPLDVIASGPTVPDPTTFADAWRVIQKYRLEDKIPASIRRHLEAGLAGTVPDTPKAGEVFFRRTYTTIIGSNAIALTAAAAKARELAFDLVILSSRISGEAREAARQLVDTARQIAEGPHHLQPVCLLMGGETTVTVRGTGKGGRNQEFALAAAIQLAGLPQVTVLSGGTDGSDGPTDAAGAVVDHITLQRAKELLLDPVAYLQNNDAYHFFEKTGGLLITGPTLTNVMDIMLALVYSPGSDSSGAVSSTADR
jgi:glycerate 2-kinase